MTEDEVERRLRRALRARAERLVGADETPPAVATGGRRVAAISWLSLAAAAVVVLAVAGGTVALRDASGSTHRHRSVAPAQSESEQFTEPSTAAADPAASPTASTSHSSRTSTAPRHRTRSHMVASSRAGGPPPASQVSLSDSPPAPCTEPNNLYASIGGDRMTDQDGGDYTFIEIQNIGKTTCTLAGYPTIHIWQRGTELSQTVAQRTDVAPQTLTLKPNDKVEFEIYDVVGTDDACTTIWTEARWLEIDLPGVSGPNDIDPYGYSACQLAITALHAPEAHP